MTTIYFEGSNRKGVFVLQHFDNSVCRQHAWSVNHMFAPSPLSAGINTRSRGTGAASDALESQEANRGESGGLLFFGLCSSVMLGG